jgi:hypothetical protein
MKILGRSLGAMRRNKTGGAVTVIDGLCASTLAVIHSTVEIKKTISLVIDGAVK